MPFLGSAYLVPGVFVILTPWVTFLPLKKHLNLKIVIVSNLCLFGFSVVISGIGYLIALGEPGRWAGLGFVILMMLTFFATLISTGLFVLMFVAMRSKAKA